MTEQVVQRLVPAPLDPDTWYTGEQIRVVRPWATDAWLKARRDERSLPFTKVGGHTSACLYRVRDIDAFIAGRVVQATCGPLAEKSGRTDV